MKVITLFLFLLMISIQANSMQFDNTDKDQVIKALKIALANHQPMGDPKTAFKNYKSMRMYPKTK